MKPPFSFHGKDLRSAIVFSFLGQTVWLPLLFTSPTDHLMYLGSAKDLIPSLENHPSYLNQTLSMQNHESVSPYVKPSLVPSHNNLERTGIVLRSAVNDGSTSSSFQSHVRHVASSYLTSSNNITYTARFGIKRSVSASSVDFHASDVGDKATVHLSGPSSFVHKLYSQSDLLGGTLTLKNMHDPLMPALARAERAQWNRSGDPLAPLPQPWREPMRRALISLLDPSHLDHTINAPKIYRRLHIDSARFVHVPSSRISRTIQVPLALQSDGSVDILSNTVDPILLDEINRWSVKQTLPREGQISAAVVNLHPLSVRLGDSDINGNLSEIRIVPRSDSLSKSQSIKVETMQPTVVERRFSSPVKSTSSQGPLPVPIDSSDWSTTSSSSSSPQTTEKKPGFSVTAVSQPDMQGAAESLQESGS